METDDREYEEIRDALTSLVTCSIVSHAVRHAYVKVCEIQEGAGVVSKQDLNKDIKRDFRFVKTGQYRRSSQRYKDDILGESQYRRDEYESSFFRDYQATALRDINRTIQPHLMAYEHVKTIDLSGQLQQDSTQMLSELVNNIAGCPLEVLVLSNNKITDDGLKILATKIRSFRYLHTLYLNHNQFTDDGIESLFHSDHFSSTLRILNIAFNKLGKTAAWSIGRMFAPGKIADLEELSIGGQVNYYHSIDHFFISLIPHLIYPGARKLKKLDISASGLSVDGIAALITLIGWTTSIEILNMSRIPVEPSKYRFQFILALLMNQSLRHLNIQACGYRLPEMKSIQWFIESRHLPEFDISSFLFSSYLEVGWCDQIEFLKHIITQKTILEQKRVQEENEIIEKNYTPPPILRPVLQTKNQDSFRGSGVTNVEKASKYLTLDEIAKLNPLSIASRSRRSVSLVQRTPPIVERYRFPLTILYGLQTKLNKEYHQTQNELIYKNKQYEEVQRSKSSLLILRKESSTSTSTPTKTPKPQQTFEKRYQKYLKVNKTNQINGQYETTLEQKLHQELLQFYFELIQFQSRLTIQIHYTNLEFVYQKFFIYNSIKKEILVINTPHQFAHYVTDDHRLYKLTILLLKLLKNLILNEEEIRNQIQKGKEIKKKMKCEIIWNETFLEREIREGRSEIDETNEKDLGMFHGEDGFDDEVDEKKPNKERKDNTGKILDIRGIGRKDENQQEQEEVDELISQRGEIMKRYGLNENYRGILSSSSQGNRFDIDHLFLDRDPSTFAWNPSCGGGGLYHCYLDYRRRYLVYHLRYSNLTTQLVQELEECFLLCQSLGKHHSPPAVALHESPISDLLSLSLIEEKCIERMKCLEMMFQDLLSLQHELLTLLQIIHSTLIAMEMAYYENIYQFSQTNPLNPSNIAPSTRKFAYTRASSVEFSSYLRVYNPSCPISSAHIIRCLYPTYALSAIYLGYFYLSEEVESRFIESLPDLEKPKSISRLISKENQDDSISYKSLLSLEEGTLDSSSQTSSLKSENVKKRKSFKPTKGRKMKYPTKEELKKKKAFLEKMNEEPPQETEGVEGGPNESNVTKNFALVESNSQIGFPLIRSPKSQATLQSNLGSKLSLPLIPASSRTIQSGERDDDISALTSPGRSSKREV